MAENDKERAAFMAAAPAQKQSILDSRRAEFLDAHHQTNLDAQAEAEAAEERMKAGTAAVLKARSGPPLNKAATSEDLESKTKAELVALAEARGLAVTRSDGKDGDPLREDYIRALGG